MLIYLNFSDQFQLCAIPLRMKCDVKKKLLFEVETPTDTAVPGAVESRLVVVVLIVAAANGVVLRRRALHALIDAVLNSRS